MRFADDNLTVHTTSEAGLQAVSARMTLLNNFKPLGKLWIVFCFSTRHSLSDFRNYLLACTSSSTRSTSLVKVVNLRQSGFSLISLLSSMSWIPTKELFHLHLELRPKHMLSGLAMESVQRERRDQNLERMIRGR